MTQPLGDTAAGSLALRGKATDLEAAGICVIQVDEPALRELLSLRHADGEAYLDSAMWAFRLASSGAADATQIHPHLCYSEFGEIISAIAALDADVTGVEAARSRMELAAGLTAAGSERVSARVCGASTPPRPCGQRDDRGAVAGAAGRSTLTGCGLTRIAA